MAAGTSMANNLVDFDRPPEWLQLHASDFRRTADAIERLKPMMDAALTTSGDELPL
jgi:phage terminase small subunit